MAECPYCLETGTRFNLTELDPGHHVEVEVIACKIPYLMVRSLHSGRFPDWSIGMQIKYCPMCGRRLDNGN